MSHAHGGAAAFHAALYPLAPRGRARVDVRTPAGGWAHSYERTRRLGPVPPDGPYAWYLTNQAEEYLFLGFDLDPGGYGVRAVERDAEELQGLLYEADLRYLVCESGPGGGVHVWVPIEATAAAVVRQIAYAAGRRLPTLDKSPLTNARTGCLRPPGAPHRDGGWSRPVHDWVPITAQAAAAVLSVPNSAEAVERLAVLLDAGDVDPAQIEAERVRAVEQTPEGPRLAGQCRPCDVAGLLAVTPPAGQGHAQLMRILVRLALARWSPRQAAELIEAELSAPGLIHLRRPGGAAGSRLREAAERARLLERQWERAVAYAATLRRKTTDQNADTTADQTAGHEHQDDAEAGDTVEDAWVRRVAAVVDLVDGVERAIEAETAAGRWSRQSGPSDRKTVEYVLELALDAVSEEIEIDCRRLALATGMGKSTAARALHRMCLDEWLCLVTQGEGQRAHRYRVLPRTLEDAADQPSVRSSQAGASAVTEENSGGGGTQGNPPPVADLRPALALREQRRAALRRRRQVLAHDLFTHPSPARDQAGLGRHVAATAAAALGTGMYKVKDLAGVTGYRPATVRRHLDTLARHQLAPTRRPSTTPQARQSLQKRLDRAARRIGADGTRERRHRGYAVERAAYAWWLAEHDWMRTKGKPRKGQKQVPGQRRLVLAGAPSHANRDRYPRDRHGRADHRAARTHLRVARPKAAA